MKKTIKKLRSAGIIAGASTPPILDASNTVVPGSIAVLEKITIGGIAQWMSIRGADIENPVILFVHGGPGVPEMPLVRHYNAGLEKDFVIVVWDQRGAGKSFSGSIPKETMKVDRFVEDVHELTDYLKRRFRKEKIFIVGHSWGSLISMLVIQKFPLDFYGYIGIGQFVNGRDNERCSYEFTLREAKKRGDKNAFRKLEKIGAPVNGLYTGDWRKDLGTQRKYLVKYGGALYGKDGYSDLIKVGVFSHEYTLRDLVGFVRGMFFSTSSMWQEIIAFDLEKSVPAVRVPVFFFEGRFDFHTPFELAERYCKTIEAPQKHFVYFEKSSHSPGFEESDLFVQRVREKFLPLAGKQFQHRL